MKKRTDNKGRVLRKGESQRKNGKYVYTYYDLSNIRKYVYSWRLEETDIQPEGKRSKLSLRELERMIQIAQMDEIVQCIFCFTQV